MQVTYRQGLQNHADRVREFDLPIVDLALMSKSIRLRDVIAYLATNNTFTGSELKEAVLSGGNLDVDVRADWLAEFGWTVASQLLEEDDTELGLKSIQLAKRISSKLPKKRPYDEFLAALLFDNGAYEELRSLVHSNPKLAQSFYNYLEVDTWNPFVIDQEDHYDAWLEGFNLPFVAHGLSPLALSREREQPFDCIIAESSEEPIYSEPKISVIMTSYKPEPDAFSLAAESILKQSWLNLELIIVDDATPGGAPEVLRQLEEADDRVRVITQPENLGTYRARNAGIEVATGDYITGQDSDDWSHPDRLLTQIRYLETHPEVVGVRTRSVRAYDNLVRVNRGKHPITPCEISFMVPTYKARRVGGYLPARKAADTEFRRRIEQHFGRTTLLQTPLYIARLSSGSLSRGDFGVGWAHPARRAFRSAFSLWHKRSALEDLRLKRYTEDTSTSPVVIPPKFHISTPQLQKLDVVFVGDWRAYGSSQRAMAEEIQAVIRADKTVGIMHLESIMNHDTQFWLLHERVQEWINNGLVTQVIPDEGYTTELVVAHDPTLLQFLPESGVELLANQVIVIPDLPPASMNKEEVFYDPRTVNSQATEMFGGPVMWAPVDPAIHGTLAPYEDDITLHKGVLRPTFDPRRWTNRRNKFDRTVPIVGRHSEMVLSAWPAEAQAAEQLWPNDRDVEVRILGEERSCDIKYQGALDSSRWVVFDDGRINPEAFMRSLDFFVYFPDEQWPQMYCQQAFEAHAAGCIVLLPKQFEKIHKKHALYVEPEQVPAIVRELSQDVLKFQDYLASIQRGGDEEMLEHTVHSVNTSTLMLSMIEKECTK